MTSAEALHAPRTCPVWSLQPLLLGDVTAPV